MPQLAFGARRGQVIDRLTLKNSIDGGDGLHAKLRSDGAVFIDVDLGELHPGGEFCGHLFKHGSQRLARAAPFRPEIEDDERIHRRIDHVALERLDRLAFSRSEEHTSELQSLMRISYAVFYWK